MRALFLLLFTAAPALADPDCFCTDREGARVELGQEICMTVDGRAFMARCEMTLNTPSWKPTGEMCVSSRLRFEPVEPARNLGRVHPHVALAEHEMRLDVQIAVLDPDHRDIRECPKL